MEQIIKKTDRRILKTKKAIKSAFIELLAIKDFNDITIQDIADKADINRKTFYNYYNGIYEVVTEIEDEIVASFDELFTDIEFQQDKDIPAMIFEKITTVINNSIDFYCGLLKINGNTDLINKMLNILKKKVKESLLKRIVIDEKYIDFVTEYCILGLLSTYLNWFNKNKNISIEQLTSDLTTIMFEGINGFIKDKITND